MTGNIVTDFFAYIAIASIGAAVTYGAWRLLLDKPENHAFSTTGHKPTSH